MCRPESIRADQVDRGERVLDQRNPLPPCCETAWRRFTRSGNTPLGRLRETFASWPYPHPRGVSEWIGSPTDLLRDHIADRLAAREQP